MKKRLAAALACTALVTAGVLYSTSESALAGHAVARGISDPGYVTVAGTVNNVIDGKTYLVVYNFVRVPGSSDWAPGIISVWGPSGSRIIREVAVHDDPFVMDFSSHSTAFVNTSATYQGAPANLFSVIQDWSSIPDRITLVVMGASSTFTLSGEISGFVQVSP